tara:strand:- start:229 stop:900 length:672 start_codon:yes stop_codon:yes gene_type:complete
MASLKRIDLTIVTNETISTFPQDFTEFAEKNGLSKALNNKSANGKALAALVNTREYYWTPPDCEEFCKKFNIKSRDSIQLFNKKPQDGFEMIGKRGRYAIKYPYEVSNKKAMRLNFVYDGSEEQKNKRINKIKQNIKEDYIDISNNKWQLGHKNPDTTDSTNKNLVLQPPIQAKYRDDYIFIDTLTKIPTPKKLKKLIDQGESPYTKEQLRYLRDILINLNLS